MKLFGCSNKIQNDLIGYCYVIPQRNQFSKDLRLKYGRTGVAQSV